MCEFDLYWGESGRVGKVGVLSNIGGAKIYAKAAVLGPLGAG